MWVGSVKKGAILDLVHARDSQTLFTLDGSGQVTRWDLAARQPTALFGVDAEAFSEECRPRLALSPDGRYLLATDDERIAVWDLKAGVPGKPVDCGDGSITHPCFASNGCDLYTVGVAATWLIRWSWPRLRKVPLQAGLSGLTEFALAAAADGSGASLAVFTSGGAIVVWDLTRGRLLMTVQVEAGDFDEVPMAFAPGGKTFVAGHGTAIQVCDLRRKKVLHTFEAEQGPVWRVAFHPGGSLFALAGAGPVVGFWDVPSGKQVKAWEMPLKKVHSLAFSPDGCTCAAGGNGRKLVVWDVES